MTVRWTHPSRALQVPRHGQRGRARVQGDAFAVYYQCRRSRADLLLLGALKAFADVKRALRPAPA